MSEYIEQKGLGRLKDNLKSFIVGVAAISIVLNLHGGEDE